MCDQRVQGEYTAHDLVLFYPFAVYCEDHLVGLECGAEEFEDELLEFRTREGGIQVDFEDLGVDQFNHHEVYSLRDVLQLVGSEKSVTVEQLFGEHQLLFVGVEHLFRNGRAGHT